MRSIIYARSNPAVNCRLVKYREYRRSLSAFRQLFIALLTRIQSESMYSAPIFSVLQCIVHIFIFPNMEI